MSKSRQTQRGVALVITLIMLTIITVIAVAFLAVTHRERSTVKQKANSTDAEYAGLAGLERAKAQILAYFNTNDPARSNAVGPDFIVSRNYINPRGFDPNLPPGWVTNVNYSYRIDQSAIAPDTVEYRQNLTNLLIDPRPPVFVKTNLTGTAPFDFRYFVDLNRNGMFEESGFLPVRDNNGNFVPDPNNPGAYLTNYFMGDPQWIGVLEHPNQAHGPNNYFIGRYAYLILPLGRTLDVNWIHNQALGLTMAPPQNENGFYRNQGVGCWEINLAAFLADLNTNAWSSAGNGGIYSYDPLSLMPSIKSQVANGAAFNDARELLSYRYNGSYQNLATPYGIFPQGANTAIFSTDFIDDCANGPLVSPGVALTPSDEYDDDPTKPWACSDSARHFFALHDFFDPSKLPLKPPATTSFTNRLDRASRAGSTYDRYTFYRMLAQLGTDSLPDDDAGKININYVNVGGIAATELIPWNDPRIQQIITTRGRPGRSGPDLFFLSVVTNLFQRESNFTNYLMGTVWPNKPLRILVFTNGSRFSTNGPYYSARIHQILQQAANIYDATRDVRDVPGAALPPLYFPTVFRPQFEKIGNAIYIVNYKEVVESANVVWALRNWLDLEAGESPSPSPASAAPPDDNVYGIPLIVGARKGFPNFNEFALQSVAQATRRLTFYRTLGTTNITRIEEVFTLRLTNQFGFEAWNSYTSSYPRNIEIYFGNKISVLVTNSSGIVPTPASIPTNAFGTNVVAFDGATKPWLGQQYAVPGTVHQPVLSWTNVLSPPEAGGTSNRWGLTVTNNVRLFVVDTSIAGGRIVDAVSLGGIITFFDVAGELGRNLAVPEETSKFAVARLWNNGVHPSGHSQGVANQILASRDATATEDTDWRDYSDVPSKQLDVRAFNSFLTDALDTNASMQAPFTPSRMMIQTNYWRVNDPLVHYTLDDLRPTAGAATVKRSAFRDLVFGTENPEYLPWGGKALAGSAQDEWNPALRDPSVNNSDQWSFPNNRFANIGWLGQVHRGTPWQTIYLKSMSPPLGNWKAHSGPRRSDASAQAISPTNDWRLLDIFTTTIHPNALRGRLPINQTNLAAWSAVLSGVLTRTVTNDPSINWTLGIPSISSTNAIVPPVAISNLREIETIVAGINRTRTNYLNKQFNRLSDILAVPELTVGSPFINGPGFDAAAPPLNQSMYVYDTDYERIPQQILSLLQVGQPRFVVYTFGQSLRPARYDPTGRSGSIYTGSAYQGLCQNYEITGEVATRAVVRLMFGMDGAGQPNYGVPRAVVESFNILPPD